MRRLKAYAHRGFAPNGEENTMAAFRNAVELGYTYLETDVRTTADGHLMVFHDETLDRVSNAKGPISRWTRAELADVRVAGEPIPTFEELLTAWPHVQINVDLKDWAAVDAFADLVIRHAAQHRVVAASFSDARTRRLRTILKQRGSRPVRTTGGVELVGALTLLGLMSRGRFQPWRLLKGAMRRAWAVQVPLNAGPIPVLTRGFVSRAHEAGLEVHAWVINDAPTMRRLINLGVDGIMTDRADLLAEVLREQGLS